MAKRRDKSDGERRGASLSITNLQSNSSLRKLMTTIYTVEIITFLNRAGAWYKTKEGQQFECELGVRVFDKGRESGRAAFKVGFKWIDPNHCKIISEIKVK